MSSVSLISLSVFVAIFSFCDAVRAAPCGGSFSSAQGAFTSPNWPEDYPAQSVCTWRIHIPSAERVHVDFTHFEVQAVNILGNCVDYVEIFSGENTTSQGWISCRKFSFFFLLSAAVIGMNSATECFAGRFCGFSPPHPLTIVGNTVVIRFLSNGANHQKGFRGYWTTDPGVVPTLPPAPTKPWDNITISEWRPSPRAVDCINECYRNGRRITDIPPCVHADLHGVSLQAGLTPVDIQQ